jgi:phosphoglycolate phosphatase-like HAD superfamily hydrolase
MLEAVIFDVDGTLVDSVDLHAAAWEQAFRDYGHDVAAADIRGQIGKGGDQLMPVFLSKNELDEHGEALERHRRQILTTGYLPQIRRFPKVREPFERLLADGTRIAWPLRRKPTS